jgi:hypothetical protein
MFSTAFVDETPETSSEESISSMTMNEDRPGWTDAAINKVSEERLFLIDSFDLLVTADRFTFVLLNFKV